MTLLSLLLVVFTSLAMSSPVPDNMGFMRSGADVWHGVGDRDRFGLQSQERVRRQQRPGRPMRKVQQVQGRPDGQARPQQQERYYKAKQNRPLQAVKKQRAPVKKTFQQEPTAERKLQAYEPEQETVEREEQMRNQEMYNEVDRSYNTKPEPSPLYERSYETRPEPSTVYERSATPAQDSLESESFAAPAEQRDLEAAVAAGAAGYTGESYAEPQRLSFQIHGQEGPNSYKFGYDTGVGYNRQFRYEERDNYGVLHGRYGYYDQEGKLQVVNYTADPEKGFHAEGEHVPKPQYR